VFTLPCVAVVCAWRAVRAGAGLGRWARVIFWTGTLAGGAITAALLQGLYERLQEAPQKHLALAAAGLLALVLAFVLAREALAGNLKRAGWIVDVLGGGVCLAVILVSGYFIWVKGFVEPLRQKAEARWAQIGRPMADFGNALHPVAENESLRELTRDLKPWGVVTFYKAGSGDGRVTAMNQFDVPEEIVEELNDRGSEGDFVKVSDKAAATLDAKRKDFDAIYDGILRREPPVWEMDTTHGSYYYTLIPDFLTARKFAQWSAVDAYHRLQQGDEKGAARAMEANLRMVHNLGEQPILVSNMIHCAIECLFARIEARLPEDPGAMKQLAADVTAERKQFQVTLQSEAWVLMRICDEPQPQMGGLIVDSQPWPKWLGTRLRPIYGRTAWQQEVSKTWLTEADAVELSDRAPGLPDLGGQELDDIYNREATFFTPNMMRVWLRINCGLLLREQAEMIREARGQMEAGKSGDLGAHDSVVVPGLKWVLSGDATAYTVTVKLATVPQWLADNPVTDESFWLTPLDGSKPWALRPAAKVSAAELN
ncbi:MAG TPA: hypothetical protein VG733_20165, partial [Chthoniobacteraceae bacterium]|nr:hypothetical protein [Chthoniobacteraceae bacterium]